MALSTFVAARDEILTMFKTAWDAQAAPIPKVVWGDVESDPPKDGAPWVRVQVLHQLSGQATLGEGGSRRFRREGLVVARIHTKAGDGLVGSDFYSKLVVDAYEGKTSASGSVWFRNVRLNELGQDGDWHVSTVMADFEYDEVK